MTPDTDLQTSTWSPKRKARANGHAAADRSRSYGKLKVYTLGDEEPELSRDYMMKGVLYAGDMSFLFGPPGCGKTTLGIYLGLAFAQGRNVFGRKVRPSRVFYLALEGKDLFLAKMRVFEDQFGSSRDLVYCAQSLTLLADGADGPEVRALIDAVQGERADIVIVDTWSKLMAGLDDNAHKEASAMLQVLTRLREECGAHVMVLAHPNKSSDDDVAGSYTVRKDADALLRVRDNDGIKTVEALKLRFGSIGELFSFRMPVAVIGKDDDGDDVTCVAIEEIEGSAISRKPVAKLFGNQALHLKEIVGLVADSELAVGNENPTLRGTRGMAVGRDAVRRRFSQKGWLESGPDEPMTPKDRDKLRNMLDALEKKGLITANKDWVQLL